MKHKGKSNSTFRHPKQVLLFGHTRILVAIFKSMQSCAEITGTSVKTVSRACKGEYAQAAGFYFGGYIRTWRLKWQTSTRFLWRSTTGSAARCAATYPRSR